MVSIDPMIAENLNYESHGEKIIRVKKTRKPMKIGPRPQL